MKTRSVPYSEIAQCPEHRLDAEHYVPRHRTEDCNGLKAYWVSCPQFTCRIAVDHENIIREACPLLRRFIGQPFANLRKWRTLAVVEL